MDHERNKQKIDSAAKIEKVGVDQQQFDQVTNKVKNKYDEFGHNLKRTEDKQNNKYNVMQGEVSKDIGDGAKKADSWAYNMKDSIKPDFAKDKKEK